MGYLSNKRRKDWDQTSRQRQPTSYRGRPSMITHARLGLVVFGLSAGGSTDGGVGEIHVRRHRAWVRRACRFRISKIVGRSRRRHAPVRRRGPTQAGHMWAATDAVGPVVAVRWGLKRLRRTVRIGSHRWSRMRCTSKARKRRGGGCGGSTRATLGEIASKVRRNGPATHVIIAGRARHRQRRKITAR